MTQQADTVVVNGVEQDTSQWLGYRLLDYLRLGLRLTGSKEGCGEGECGACTVLVDGDPMCSCLLLVDVVAGRDVLTVEGVARETVSRLAAGFDERGGIQCGFCTPGFVVMTEWLRTRSEMTSDDDIPKLLEGNLCRCTGYRQLREVIGDIVTNTARTS